MSPERCAELEAQNQELLARISDLRQQLQLLRYAGCTCLLEVVLRSLHRAPDTAAVAAEQQLDPAKASQLQAQNQHLLASIADLRQQLQLLR